MILNINKTIKQVCFECPLCMHCNTKVGRAKIISRNLRADKKNEDERSTSILVIGSSILVYNLIENQQMNQIDHFIVTSAPTCFGVPTSSSRSSYDPHKLLICRCA
jgi:hypothetical protein